VGGEAAKSMGRGKEDEEPVVEVPEFAGVRRGADLRSEGVEALD